MTTGLTWEEFDGLFQRFADSPTSLTVYRWEGLQYYAIPSDEPSLVAFRNGTPRPERSVRTDPWLARIATSTTAGKRWKRVRPVARPLTEYVRWEMLAYVESQAAGEEIRIGAGDGPDVWVFTGDDPADRYAVVMHYDESGVPVHLELVTDPTRVQAYLDKVSAMFNDATPLNHYLASSQWVSSAA